MSRSTCRLLDPAWSRDRFGRLLVYIFFEGEFVNERLFEAGFERCIIPPNTRFSERFTR